MMSDLRRQKSYFYIPYNSYVMTHCRIWLLDLYFELFPRNKMNNNRNQTLIYFGAAGKRDSLSIPPPNPR